MLENLRLLGFISKLVGGLFLVGFGVHMIIDPGHVTLYESGLFVLMTILYYIAVKKD
jgi:hypothetical protein